MVLVNVTNALKELDFMQMGHAWCAQQDRI
jgi:hypothetical protein